jgi:hypothetical protein
MRQPALIYRSDDAISISGCLLASQQRPSSPPLQASSATFLARGMWFVVLCVASPLLDDITEQIHLFSLFLASGPCYIAGVNVAIDPDPLIVGDPNYKITFTKEDGDPPQFFVQSIFPPLGTPSADVGVSLNFTNTNSMVFTSQNMKIWSNNGGIPENAG